MNTIKLPFYILFLLISFASVNAVLFTPALPDIALFFNINEGISEQTVTWFLIGYTMGQLAYGPAANRFGRKNAIYCGITVQIISSLMCVLAGYMHWYWLLIIGRFLLGLGSGVGFKMTFTLVNECYEPKLASQTISYLVLSLAITPGLGVALGGLLMTYFNWTSCFYAGAIYGLILLLIVTKLPETQLEPDLHALQFNNLKKSYLAQFKNLHVVSGGLLFGCAGCFIYLFAAAAPFVAIEYFKLTTAEYGAGNLMPLIGFIVGSFVGASLTNYYSLVTIIKIGIGFSTLGSVLMCIAMILKLSSLPCLFLPMILIYFGIILIIPNTSTIVLSQVQDKSHGSAVMNFLNVGLATVAVFGISFFTITPWLLPLVYIILCILMTVLFHWFKLQNNVSG